MIEPGAAEVRATVDIWTVMTQSKEWALLRSRTRTVFLRNVRFQCLLHFD